MILLSSFLDSTPVLDPWYTFGDSNSFLFSPSHCGLEPRRIGAEVLGLINIHRLLIHLHRTAYLACPLICLLHSLTAEFLGKWMIMGLKIRLFWTVVHPQKLRIHYNFESHALIGFITRICVFQKKGKTKEDSEIYLVHKTLTAHSGWRLGYIPVSLRTLRSFDKFALWFF